MHHKRMSLTIQAKCAVRQQMDQFIEADYQLLNQHPKQHMAVFQCHLTNNNPIIRQYIKVVEQDYNIPNPLHNRSSKASSKKKLQLSLLNSSKEHFDLKNNDKNKKKLTITGQKRSNQQSLIESNQSNQHNTPIMTPKFFNWEQETDRHVSKELINDSSAGRNGNQPSLSLNRISSKQKPIHFHPQPRAYHHSTAKKGSNFSNQSQFSQHNFQSRATIKKNQHENRINRNQSDDSIHNNPVISKIQKKNLEDYYRSGRMTNSALQQSGKKLKIKDSYRYCIGCEEPILQHNIRSHQQQCLAFRQISGLPSNLQVLKIVHAKIAKIEAKIPANISEIEQRRAGQIRDRSSSLVRESRKRPGCSPESSNFQKDYESIMEIGKKWCSYIEEVNKLRWFTRIAQKLESLVSQES